MTQINGEISTKSIQTNNPLISNSVLYILGHSCGNCMIYFIVMKQKWANQQTSGLTNKDSFGILTMYEEFDQTFKLLAYIQMKIKYKHTMLGSVTST